MRTVFMAAASAALLAGCDGNPFIDGPPPAADAGATTAADNPGIVGGAERPPGTTNPTPDSTIVRSEPFDLENGNGFAQGFSYDAANDRLTIDNLAFDGDNSYNRDNVVGSLGPFAVYENNNPIRDPINGTPIGQFEHKAIYGISPSGNARVAVARTGAYIEYGFGGFVYQRDTGVTLPTSGQAAYSGDYAGLRDFNNSGGLEYVTGDAFFAIDFEDFNDGSGVRGEITNRSVFSTQGVDLTQAKIADINASKNANITALPTLRFRVGPGVLDSNGELVGEVFSTVVDAGTGVAAEFETGNYYAILSGDNAEEIVGVIVVESDLSNSTISPTTGNVVTIPGVQVRETGVFIATR